MGGPNLGGLVVGFLAPARFVDLLHCFGGLDVMFTECCENKSIPEVT